jgi:outer membrane protein assembly factor BamB
VRTHYLQGRWDTLLTIAAEDSFHLNIAPPTLWVNPQGDSVLFIRDNGLRDVLATPWEGRYNLVSLSAWNMRTRQYEWKIKDFLDQFAVMQRPPIVEGDRAYFLTSGALHGFDLVTGTRAWSRPLPNVAIHAGIVQHGDYIIAQSSYDGMWAVDKSNGAIRWHNPKTYGTPTLLSYFDGVAYFTSTGSSRLWAVNAETGQTIWDEPSPNAFSPRTPNAGFDFANVVIDPVRRVLYTADKYYMMCIKLPE